MLRLDRVVHDDEVIVLRGQGGVDVGCCEGRGCKGEVRTVRDCELVGGSELLARVHTPLWEKPSHPLVVLEGALDLAAELEGIPIQGRQEQDPDIWVSDD